MPKSRKRKLNRPDADLVAPPAGPIDVDVYSVRPGQFDAEGGLTVPDGKTVRRTKHEITPKEAMKLVRHGAVVAYEGCGCGGGGGCQPSWTSAADAKRTAESDRPHFTDRHGSPTWIDLWRGDDAVVVFLHGDVKWGDMAE